MPASVPESQEYPLVWPGIGRACLGFPCIVCAQFQFICIAKFEPRRGGQGGLRAESCCVLRVAGRLLWPRLFMPLPFRGLLRNTFFRFPELPLHVQATSMTLWQRGSGFTPNPRGAIARRHCKYKLQGSGVVSENLKGFTRDCFRMHREINFLLP